MEPPSSIPVSPISFDAVYVVNGGDGMNGSISVINASTNTVARTIVLTGAMWPHHIYMSADRTKLLVAVPGMDLSMGHDQPMPPDMMGAVMLLDAKTGATIKSRMLPAMNHNAVFSPNQKEVWTSQMMMDIPGSVLVLSATTLATLKEIPVGAGAHAIDFSADGSTAYITNQMANTVSVIDVGSRTVKKTVAVGNKPNGLLFRMRTF